MDVKPPHDPGQYLPLLWISLALVGWATAALWAGKVGFPSIGWARRAERPVAFWAAIGVLIAAALACTGYFLNNQPRI